jgi:hypothetical protein
MIKLNRRHKKVLSACLHGNPELALLLAKFGGNFIQYLWEFLQDFKGNVPVGFGCLCLADPFNMENKSGAMKNGIEKNEKQNSKIRK